MQGSYLGFSLEKMPVLQFAHRHQAEPSGWKLFAAPGIIEITYLKTGDLTLTNNHQCLHAQTGDVICLDHSQPWTATVTSPLHIHYTAAIQVDKIAEYDSYTVPDPLSVCLAQCCHPENNAELVMKIQKLAKCADPVSAAVLCARLINDLHLLTKADALPEDPLCSRLKELIADRLDRSLSPAALADELHISYGHLSRLFKQQEHCTVTQYIHRRKLQRVQELLRLYPISLEEAGLAVGISDVKYLSRLFHREYGVCPREYRHSQTEME